MAEEEKKPGGADNRKKKFSGRFAKGAAVEARTRAKCKDLRTTLSMLGHQETPQSLASC
jgi:hypothetical protein